jgi:DNA-directed RNA polymerase subunit RPC12/RpoP
MLTSNAARNTATPKPFFKCRNCDALYHIVKIEGGSESADREIACRGCGGPLPRPRWKIRHEVFSVAEGWPYSKMETVLSFGAASIRDRH